MSGNPAALVLGWAESTPQTPAIISNALSISYGELADSVRRMAAKFRKLGVRPGAVVGIRARPEVEAVVMIALLHEGAVSLNASEAVLAAYAAELDFLVTDGQASSRGGVRTIAIDAAFLASLGAVNPRIDPQPLQDSSPCRIVFSSGTTGSPKGVEFTVDSLIARTDSARRNWMPHDPFMCLLGLDTVSGFQTMLWGVMHGHSYVIPGDGPTNLGLIARLGIKSIKTSPARLENLVDAAEADPNVVATVNLDAVQVAGSLLSATLAGRCERVLGCTPIYLYGSTEVGTVTRGTFDSARPNMVGTVIDEVELELVDASGHALDHPADPAVIRYRTPFNPRSYWRASPSANAAFRDGWFHPGDLGILSETGQLLISGRADDLVNAGGAKFNLAELDLWMAEFDFFTDAASFQFEDAAGATCVGIAFSSRHPVNPTEIVTRVRGLLPNLDVKALVRVESIPRNQLGKVERKALSALVAEQ